MTGLSARRLIRPLAPSGACARNRRHHRCPCPFFRLFPSSPDVRVRFRPHPPQQEEYFGSSVTTTTRVGFFPLFLWELVRMKTWELEDGGAGVHARARRNVEREALLVVIYQNKRSKRQESKQATKSSSAPLTSAQWWGTKVRASVCHISVSISPSPNNFTPTPWQSMRIGCLCRCMCAGSLSSPAVLARGARMCPAQTRPCSRRICAHYRLPRKKR